MSSKRRLLIGLSVGIALALASLAASVWVLARWHQRGWLAVSAIPQIGSSTKRAPVRGPYQPRAIIMMYPGGPAHQAGLRVGDRVVSINGIDFADYPRLRELDRRARSGDMIVYRVTRGGTVHEARMRLTSPLRHFPTLLQTLVLTIVGLAFIVIGCFVFSRNTHDRRVVVFYVMTLVAGTSMLSSMAAAIQAGIRGITHEPAWSASAPVLLLLIGLAFLPLTLHLALIFPKERPILQRVPKLLRWVYGIAAAGIVSTALSIPALLLNELIAKRAVWRWTSIAVAAAIVLFAIVLLVRLLRTRPEERFAAFTSRPATILATLVLLLYSLAVLIGAGAGRRAALATVTIAAVLPLLLFLCMPIVSCIVLYRSYRDANVEERRQVAWPLWGTIVPLSVRILVAIGGGVLGAWTTAVEGDTVLLIGITQYIEIFARALYILIPISFAVAIMKYRLMNIDVLIRKTVVYTILSGAIIFAYLVIVGGLGTILVRFAGLKNQTMVIAATLTVGLLFVPVRNKLQTLVDRNLFRHKYDYPAALRAISAEALTATDAGTFLASAAEKLQQALQNRAVVIFVPRHDEFVATAKVGVADTLLGTLRLDAAPILPMLGRPFDPRRRQLPEDAAAALKRIEATLVVPVNTPGTPPNGFVALAPKLSGGEFDVEDIDFLRSIADQLDIGIDRVRMQRDDADYAQARAIQETLLPREMPDVAGIEVSGTWQPARTVGGDYYDLLELSDHELALCIGDVAGKGMSAALLMSGLQAAVRASESRSPRELCERVRRVVVSSLSGGRFVTFFYAVIDTQTMRLRWCNAGHNAPILVRGDGSVVRLAEGGPAFSRLMRGGSFVESETAIAPGDRIVLFTDGASEATDGAGEMFGEQRLEELVAGRRELSADELQQTILDDVITHAGGELEDDLTLVVAAVTRPA